MNERSVRCTFCSAYSRVYSTKELGSSGGIFAGVHLTSIAAAFELPGIGSTFVCTSGGEGGSSLKPMPGAHTERQEREVSREDGGRRELCAVLALGVPPSISFSWGGGRPLK